MVLSRPLRDVKHDAPCRLTCETDSGLYGCRSSECGNKKMRKCPIRPAPHALRLMIRNLSGRETPPLRHGSGQLPEPPVASSAVPKRPLWCPKPRNLQEICVFPEFFPENILPCRESVVILQRFSAHEDPFRVERFF